MKWLILAGGILIGALLYLYAKSIPPVYSVRSTVFTLTSGQDNGSASSRLTELLGGGGAPKTLTDEANVSIEEVGRSKKTREAVSAERLPQFGNKTVGEVLIDEYDKHRSFMQQKIEMPSMDSDKISVGADLLQNNYSIKFNKNALLEVVNSSANPKLLISLNELLTDKLSQFYKELKRAKAKADFDFVQAKVDSFDDVLSAYDRQRVQINNTTLFVPETKLQYMIPKENLNNDKLRVLAQRNAAASNREEALWRLQKVTPIVQVLDKPELPFATEKPSSIIYGAAGFVLGCVLFTFLCIAGLIYKYAGQQVSNALQDKPPVSNTSTTA